MSLRKKFRDLRSNIPEQQRMKMASTAAALLQKDSVFNESRHIACYCAFNSEFPTNPVIEAIWQAGKVCYLPILTENKLLQFIRYEKDDELQKNQLSVPEPVNRQHTIPAEKLDLVIAPLIAFDRQGDRLGTGGGYYDRTFAFAHNREKRTMKIYGLGYSVQEAEQLDVDEWDIKLDGIITEKEIRRFHSE